MLKIVATFALFCVTASFAFPKMSEIHHMRDVNGREYYLVPVDLIQETRYKRQITSKLQEGNLVPPSLLNEQDHKVDENVLPDKHNTSSTGPDYAHEQTSSAIDWSNLGKQSHNAETKITEEAN